MLVWHARVVHDDFHARFAARGRLYRYRFLKHNDIFLRRYGLVIDSEFGLGLAREVSELFTGKHDFRAYSTQPDLDEGTECNVFRIDWKTDEYGWVMEIEADRFIRRMVRTLAGAIVGYAGSAVSLDDLRRALESGEGRVPPPAPPQGLALARIKYESDTSHDTPLESLWGGFHSHKT